MFFRFFNQPKNKFLIVSINLVLLTFFIITMNGCYSTDIYKYKKENLKFYESKKHLNDVKIKYIVLKNGTKYNTIGKDVIYDDTGKTLNINSVDSLSTSKTMILTMNYQTSLYDTTFRYSKIPHIKTETKIPVNDILDIYVEKRDIDAGLTVLAVVGVIVGLVALIFLIALATKQSCPFIYSFDGNKYVFDGEPLGGAICDGLKRTDYSRLENLEVSENKFKLLIRNEADEIQYLDELKLIVVPHEENTYVTPNPEGEFFKYKNIMQPVSVTDENGNDCTAFFKDKDDIKWQTQMPFDTSFKGGTDRHTLKFKFPKPENAKNALLFLNCGTALWGSYMIKAMLHLRGNKLDDWYANVNSGGNEIMKLYKFMEREELYFLKVNLLEGDNYTQRTYIPASGPFIDEDKIVRLPLENVKGDYIEFIINPPAGFWKFDKVGIIYDYEIIEKNKIEELDAVYAIDQNGNDFRENIKGPDKKYYTMPEVGNFSNVYFDVPQGFDKIRNELFLRTTGFYDINVDKKTPEQKDMIEEIYAAPGKIIKYSMKLYNQKIKDITERKSFDNIKIK